MGSEIADNESTRVRVALAFAAYKAGAVRLAETDLTGFTHIVATRRGLFAVNETAYLLIAYGFFFGITIQGSEIFAFEACDIPHSATRMGRIVKLERRSKRVVGSTVVAAGLDNGCHQIDFIDGQLCVVDTYNQQIVRFSADFARHEILSPLPVKFSGRWDKEDSRYVHMNSVLSVQDKILLLLHNGAQHTGRQSEIAICDRDWQMLGTCPLPGTGCHGLAVLSDGTLLTCGSMEGEIITPDGFHHYVSPYMTRGLAVGENSIVIGSSRLTTRDERLQAAGTVTFLDSKFETRAVLEIPGGATEVRRLDGMDASLSSYVQLAGRDVNLKVGAIA